MSLYELIRRVLRGIFAAAIAGGAAVVWGGLAGDFESWILLGAAVLVVALFLLDGAGLRSRRRRGLAILLFPRTAYLLLAGGVAFHGGIDAWVVALCVVLGAAALVAEPILFRLVKTPFVWASNVPGQPALPVRSRVYAGVTLVSVLVVLVAGLGELIGFGWWITATVLWLAYVGFVGARLVLLRLAVRRAEKKLYSAVRAFDAEQIVFTTQVNDAAHQVAMWLPYLERTGKRLLVMTTTDTAAKAIAEVTEVPVVVRRTVASFEQMVGSSLGAVFYVNANSGNNLMVRYNQYQHVHLGHGDSDKPSSYNPTHGIYSRVFSAGQAAVDRYGAHGVNIPRERFEVVGRPQVEEVEVIDQQKRPEIRTVFYAPTWRGHVEGTMFHSLHRGEAIINELLDRGMRVIFRPHPYSYSFPEDRAAIERIQQRLRSHATTSGLEHVWGEKAEKEYSITDCVNACDAMVSDVSSVVSDFLYSGKPFIMMAISVPVEDFVDEYPIARGAYVVGDDLVGLTDALDQMIGADELASTRLEVRSYYLGDFAPENYSQNFVDAALRMIELGQSTAADTAAISGETVEGFDEQETPSASEAAEDRAASESGGAQSARDVLRYRVRLLRRLTGFKQFRAAQRYTFWGLLAWALALIVPTNWSLIITTVILGISIALFWGHVTRTKRSIRAQVGEPPALFLALGLAALVIAAPHGVWGFVLLALATALNFETRALQGVRGVTATNLPGLRVDAMKVPAVSAVVNLATWAALVVGVLFASVFDVEAVELAWTIFVAVVLALSAVAFVVATAQAFASRRDALELEALVDAVAPQFAVYFASTSGAQYQYGMWEPYFQRLERPYVVIVRDRKSARAISALTTAPVIFRPTIRGLDDVIPESLRAVFYVNNGVKNTHVVERPGLMNIWLNHGDSEKPACYNPVHAMYDRIFAAGEAGIDRYERHGVSIPRSKFVITGRPQVEKIERVSADVAVQNEKTVLYAPTWVGPYKDTNVYSLPVATALISRLLERGVRVIFRAHPHNYRFAAARAHIAEVQELLRADAAASGREHVWGARAESEMSVEDCFNASDAMICDISAVVSDYLQSEKPFAIMAMSASVEGIYEDIPAARGGYIIPASLDGLDAKLDDLLGADPLRAERSKLRAYYLSDFPQDQYAQAFVDAARAVIDRDMNASAR